MNNTDNNPEPESGLTRLFRRFWPRRDAEYYLVGYIGKRRVTREEYERWFHAPPVTESTPKPIGHSSPY